MYADITSPHDLLLSYVHPIFYGVPYGRIGPYPLALHLQAPISPWNTMSTEARDAWGHAKKLSSMRTVHTHLAAYGLIYLYCCADDPRMGDSQAQGSFRRAFSDFTLNVLSGVVWLFESTVGAFVSRFILPS